MDEVLHLVGAEHGYIVLIQENGKLDYQVRQHINGLDEGVDQISRSILEEVIRTHKPVLVHNALTDPRFVNSNSVIVLKLRSIMCVPLLTKNRVIGAMYVENRSKAGRFSEEDLPPLEFFSAQASVAIDNADLNDRNLELYESAQLELAERRRLEEKDQRRQEWLAKVIEAGKALVLVTDLKMCLLLVREITVNSLGFDRVGFWLYDPEKEEIHGTFGVDRLGNFQDEFHLRNPFIPDKGNPLAMPGYYKYEPNLSEHVDLTKFPEMMGVKEHVSLSVWAGGQLIGLIFCDNALSQRPMLEEQLEALKNWGGYVGLAVRNAQLLDSVRQLNATLEQRVAERTEALQAAQQHIITQEKLASLGVLTAGVAHELRNPLNFVKNYAEASIELGQEIIEALPAPATVITPENHGLVCTNLADLMENMETIGLHSKRAEKVIQNMMQHAHTDVEHALPEATRLNDFIEQAVKLAFHSQRVQYVNFNFILNSDYAPDLPDVDMVAGNFNRAIINLVDNACDAMRRKQADLEVTLEANKSDYKPQLTIKTQRQAKTVEICIRDNGTGISEKTKSHILDPFFTTKPVGQGVGLGLYIAHDIIVNQHHGSLIFESQEGEFTNVIIRIPIQQQVLQIL
jgi:signal transduction histidine kinase